VDTRHKGDYADRYIPGSLALPLNNVFSTWAGWLLDYETPIVLVADPGEVETVTRSLMRIGLDRVVGYVPGVEQWAASGRRVDTVRDLTPEELQSRLAEEGTVLVDVRARAEFEAEHIPGARHIHLGYLAARADELPREGTVVLQCVSGDRSSAGYSVLARAGFENVVNLTGGIVGWRSAGLGTSVSSPAKI
jgi:hydroxyacylglutathione hydrolase